MSRVCWAGHVGGGGVQKCQGSLSSLIIKSFSRQYLLHVILVGDTCKKRACSRKQEAGVCVAGKMMTPQVENHTYFMF